MGCKRGGNNKKKNAFESNNFLEGIYSMKVKCHFKLRYVSTGSDWKVRIKCVLHIIDGGNLSRARGGGGGGG